MIRVYTKQRHITKIRNFMDSLELKFEIFTINDNPPLTPFDLGVSYCYPKKISGKLLYMPKKGFGYAPMLKSTEIASLTY